MRNPVIKTILGALFIGVVLTLAFKLLMLALVVGCIARLFMIRRFYRSHYHHYRTPHHPAFASQINLGGRETEEMFHRSDDFDSRASGEMIFLDHLKSRR